MNRVVVIGSQYATKKNSVDILADSLSSDGIEVQKIYWEDLHFDIKTNTVSVTQDGAQIFEEKPKLVVALGWYKSGDKSIYRDVAFSLALYLEHKKVKFWNTEMLHQRSTGKLSCMMQLALSGVNVPRTIFSLKSQNLVDDFTFPSVVKASNASRGDSNFLVKTQDDLDQAFAHTNPTNTMIVQPFMPNDHDLRVICFNGEPQLILKRSRGVGSSSHMNNTSQGGTAEWLTLDSVPAELLTISKEICKIMNREMAGIDFIPDTHSDYNYSCLEVNAVPQLTSGHDVTKKMQALANTIKGQEK